MDVERLQSIEGVEQIKRYKDFTNNFHPDGIAKLKPEEILHLNLCDWLEPRAAKINARLKDCRGIKIIDSTTKAEVLIEKFDLFHSLLNEMSPGAVANRVKGGHLMIPELKAALFDIGEIKLFGNGFFDMGIEYAGKNAGKYKPNSFFPVGTSVEKAVEMIEQALANPNNIKKFESSIVNNIIKVELEIENQGGQIFKLYVENGKSKFFPLSPL